MSNDELTVEKLDEASEVLSDAEEDMAVGVLLREKFPGRRFVRAGVADDGKAVDYFDTDPENVKRVAAVASTRGTVHRPRQVPKPTQKDFGDMFERAALRNPKSFRFLMAARRELQREAKKKAR